MNAQDVQPREMTDDDTQAIAKEDAALVPEELEDNRSLLETEVFEPQASPEDLLRPGMLIPATLQKDILIAEGETGQVIADSAGDWCSQPPCPKLRWLGTASLSPSSRLEVHFSQVVLDGEILGLNSIAYGRDNAEGLPAVIADTTPTILADLLRAGAGGVADYVDAEARRQRIFGMRMER